MCIDINICASAYFSFAYTYMVMWRDRSEARVRFKINFLDLAFGG